MHIIVETLKRLLTESIDTLTIYGFVGILIKNSYAKCWKNRIVKRNNGKTR
jgi:hypothetical protein